MLFSKSTLLTFYLLKLTLMYLGSKTNVKMYIHDYFSKLHYYLSTTHNKLCCVSGKQTEYWRKKRNDDFLATFMVLFETAWSAAKMLRL